MNTTPAILRYKIRPGDTLASIAEKFYGDFRQWRYLAALNQIQNPAILTVGDELYIPPMSSFASIEKTSRSNFADSTGAARDTLVELARRAVPLVDMNSDGYSEMGDYRTPGIFDMTETFEPIEPVKINAQRMPETGIVITTDENGMETVEVPGRRPFPVGLAVALGIVALLALDRGR